MIKIFPEDSCFEIVLWNLFNSWTNKSVIQITNEGKPLKAVLCLYLTRQKMAVTSRYFSDQAKGKRQSKEWEEPTGQAQSGAEGAMNSILA